MTAGKPGGVDEGQVRAVEWQAKHGDRQGVWPTQGESTQHHHRGHDRFEGFRIKLSRCGAPSPTRTTSPLSCRVERLLQQQQQQQQQQRGWKRGWKQERRPRFEISRGCQGSCQTGLVMAGFCPGMMGP
ncbi:unnamed protein product [Boreogadus saida]